MINCLYRIQNVLTLFEFTDARIEMLDAQVDQHVKTLVQAQAHHYAVRSGLEPLLRHLQEWQQTAEADRPALSAVDGMSGDVCILWFCGGKTDCGSREQYTHRLFSSQMIRRNVVAFDRWLADANFGLLPQCEFLLR